MPGFLLDGIFMINVLRAGQRLVGIGRHAGLDRLLRILYAIVEHLVERLRLLFICQSSVERFLSGQQTTQEITSTLQENLFLGLHGKFSVIKKKMQLQKLASLF